MEDGDAAELAAGPFGRILLELGVHGLEEGAHEGDLEGGANNGSLLGDVADCFSLAMAVLLASRVVVAYPDHRRRGPGRWSTRSAIRTSRRGSG